MGFGDNRFTTAVDEEFRCPICRDIVEEPITSQCEHVFCKSCIHEWLSRESSCPVGRKALKIHHLCEISRFYRNFYSKLEIKCEFESNGCQVICRIEDIKSHQNVCQFNGNVKYECSNGCKAMVTKKESESHNCVKYLQKIIDEKNEIISRMTDREIELNRKLLDFQITIKTKNSEINRLNETMFEKQNQGSDKINSFISLSPSMASTSSNSSGNNVYKFKLLLVGDKGVGKSSLLLRFIENSFSDSRLSTINGYRSRTIDFDDRVIDLEIWENCRQFNIGTDFREVDGIMFVYDVTKWRSFKNLNNFIKDMKRKSKSEVKRLLVGNKCDNIEAKRVDYLSALEFSRFCGIPFVETSAKSGSQVEEAFYRIVTQTVVKLSDVRALNPT